MKDLLPVAATLKYLGLPGRVLAGHRRVLGRSFASVPGVGGSRLKLWSVVFMLCGCERCDYKADI